MVRGNVDVSSAYLRLLRGEVAAQLGKARGEQTSNVNLAGANALGDLGLGEFVKESQVDDVSLTRWEFFEHLQNHFLVEYFVKFLFCSYDVTGFRWIQRKRSVRVVGLERFNDKVSRNTKVSSQFFDGRRAMQRTHKLFSGGVDDGSQFLGAARHVHTPRVITKVASQLAENCGGGEYAEGNTVTGVKSVDCFHETDVSDLNKVVEGFAAIRKPAGTSHRQPGGMGGDFGAERCAVALSKQFQ